MENSNILYIPIQINGGSDVPLDLLDRELYIKDGVLYVGKGKGNTPEVVIGKVVPNASIESPTITGKLKVAGNGIVVDKASFESSKSSYEDGRIVFVDEGQY